MGFRTITTGQYTDPVSGLTAECIALPLSDKLRDTIKIKDGQIEVHYDKFYYDGQGNVIPQFTEKKLYRITDDERLTFWDSEPLPNGASVGDAFQSNIIDKIKEIEGIPA